MPLEEITGIQFPASGEQEDPGSWLSVLEAIGKFSAGRLKDTAFLTADTADEVLSAYMARVNASPGLEDVTVDFVAFAAEAQAAAHGRAMELEVALMQKIMLGSLLGRVQSWTFGGLPGPAEGLYGHCASTHLGCEALGCPSILGGEASIVHVTGLNPAAALVAAAWIRQELAGQAGGEAPFVFSLVLDLPSWRVAMKRHFGAS